MSDPFQTHIRQSLANPVLQAALDANAERRINARQQAFASVPDYQALRMQAHTIRAEVIAHLDEYLEKFISRAEKNGMIVHRAEDAAAARRIILEIAHNQHARLIAKSKSMLSEEIELNPALESAGIKVVETDLGEYIVQLRGEKPAHIITPAVHLLRADVGRTFHEKLGVPLTDDVTTMTNVARRMLRQVFLQADIGVSGVNFGVVETGSICLVTNEGNGRMVTSLPPVHIALMGIERLVPDLEALALMLKLLPRSATGQKLSVYTSLMNAPRRGDETDGPQERHLVLVDNGRMAVQNSELREILYCIRCGACLNACPVFRELGGHAYVGKSGEPAPYPGPIGSVLSPALFGIDFGNLARASSLCGACKEACPVDIDLPKLLLRVRAGQGISRFDSKLDRPPSTARSNAPGYLRLGLKFFTWVAARPALFSAAQKAAGLAGRLLAPRQPWIQLPALSGWGYSKDFPRPAMKSFQSRWATRAKPVTPEQPLAIMPAEEIPAAATPLPEQPIKEQFAREIEALGGKMTFCTQADLAREILGLIRQPNSERVMAWKAGEGLLPQDVLAQLQATGVQLIHEPDPDIHLGLTGALAGLADTGSIVIASGEGQPLATSLLPEIHIAVLPLANLYSGLADLLADPKLRQSFRDCSALTIISGPSRTGDIEMTLTIGVHGPGQIHVLCYT